MIAQRRLAIHPLPADALRREREIDRVTRMGYRLLETYRERDGSWWGKFEAPARCA